MRTEQKIHWDEKTNKCYLQTFEGNSISFKEITSEEAAQWEAENKF